MTRPAACEYGPTGHCRNGTHGSCAHRVGGPMEHGSWVPECYLSKPPKGGHKGTDPVPSSLDHATVFTETGTSVIRPSHVWHCTCNCHRTSNPAPIIGQLELFEPSPRRSSESMTTQLSLPICASPGCQLVTEIPGTPCQDCVKAFGDMMRPGRPLTEAEITARDEAVHTAYRVARLRGVL